MCKTNHHSPYFLRSFRKLSWTNLKHCSGAIILAWFCVENLTFSWFSAMRVIGNRFPSNYITLSWLYLFMFFFQDASCTAGNFFFLLFFFFMGGGDKFIPLMYYLAQYQMSSLKKVRVNFFYLLFVC